MLNRDFLDCIARLREFIRAPSPDERVFDALAGELFRLQFEFNPVYRRLCESRGVKPSKHLRWPEFPFVPAAAFKDLEITCLAPVERHTRFRSSGTTSQARSTIFHSQLSLDLYEVSLWQWFQACFGVDANLAFPWRKVLSLTPPPERAPYSSLVHMFATIAQNASNERFEFAGEVEADDSWSLDVEVSLAFLERAAASSTPALVLGTAFGFVHLVDALAGRSLNFALPPGSRVLETGGYKGRSRQMGKPELYRLISQHLGIPTGAIVSEYGMCEISSQAYDVFAGSSLQTATPRCFKFPSWARVQIVSAETGHEVEAGEAGLIRIIDLANACSVLAIQTEDIGTPCQEGFQLLGRGAVAEPRGCSLQHASQQVGHGT